MGKHKNRKAQHKNVVAHNTTITEQTTINEPEYNNNNIFDNVVVGGGGVAKVKGVELFAIVNNEYNNKTPFKWIINKDNKNDMVEVLASGTAIKLKSGSMVFGVHFLAKNHPQDIDETTYAKGNGLQCFITPCGGNFQKVDGVRTLKPYGMVRLLTEAGYTVVEKQYKNTAKPFLGRCWFVTKPKPKPKIDETEPKTEQ